MSKKQPIEINEDLYIEIEPYAWENTVLEDIARVRNLSWRSVCLMMQYNIISFKQLMLVTGIRDEMKLRNMTTKRMSRTEWRATLTNCNPFPDLKDGKMFILVDDKCKSFIMDRLTESLVVEQEMVSDQ